jgi:hypothetical protein
MTTPEEDQSALLYEGVFLVRTLLQQPDELPSFSPVTGEYVAAALLTFPPVTDGYLAFALTMGKDGKIGLVQSFTALPYTGVEASAEGQVPEPVDGQQVRLEALRFSLKEWAAQGTLRAAALVDLVQVRPAEDGQATDAVRVQIEHEATASLICYVPYELQDNQWEQGEVWAENGEPFLFGK